MPETKQRFELDSPISVTITVRPQTHSDPRAKKIKMVLNGRTIQSPDQKIIRKCVEDV